MAEVVRWALYIDGASRSNPGPSGVGIFLQKETESVMRQGYYVGERTNNEAEYLALVLGACRVCALMETRDVLHIYSDSQLLVRQMHGMYRVRAAALAVLHAAAVQLITGRTVLFSHIPREQNIIADALANDGIDAHRVPPALLWDRAVPPTLGWVCPE